MATRGKRGRTPEERERQLVSLAVDLAEKQLSEGTASAQVITHYLKLATTTKKLEDEKLELENELTKAKVELVKSTKRSEQLFEQAIKAMKSYSGQPDYEEEVYDD